MAVLAITLLASLSSAPPSLAGYGASWYAIAGGGGPSSSGGGYTLGGTIGQPAAGWLGGSGYGITEGYWAAIGGPYLVSVDERRAVDPPATFLLEAPSPNPVSGRALVRFELPEPRAVTLRLFDITGRLVRTIAQGRFPAGRFQRSWDAREGPGRAIEAGIYVLQLDAQTVQLRQKVVVVR